MFMVCCMTDLPVGTAWWCCFLTLASLLSSLVPTMSCKLESLSPVTLKNWFLRHAAVLLDALFGEPARLSTHTIENKLHGTASEMRRNAEGVWSGTLLDDTPFVLLTWFSVPLSVRLAWCTTERRTMTRRKFRDEDPTSTVIPWMIV